MALRRRRLVFYRPQFAGHEQRALPRSRTVRLAGGATRRPQGQPLALFLHKPLFLNKPEDPELAATSFRYVPMPARPRLLKMLGEVDWRLVASGHVHQRRDFTFSRVRHIWAPSAAFVIADTRQEVIGLKETGLVEYRFQPDSVEVRHVRAPGQVDIDLDELMAGSSRTKRTRARVPDAVQRPLALLRRARIHRRKGSFTACPVDPDQLRITPRRGALHRIRATLRLWRRASGPRACTSKRYRRYCHAARVAYLHTCSPWLQI